MIDGCSRFGTFRRVVLPLALPGIAARYLLISFAWSELMFSRFYLSTMFQQTIPVFLSLFVGQYQTGGSALLLIGCGFYTAPLLSLRFFKNTLYGDSRAAL